MNPTTVFEVQPNHCWDALPELTKWREISEALILDTGWREFIPVNWSMGPRNFHPWFVENFQRSMRLTITAGHFKSEHLVRLEWVSQVLLASGTVYKVTPTPWLLDEQ